VGHVIALAADGAAHSRTALRALLRDAAPGATATAWRLGPAVGGPLEADIGSPTRALGDPVPTVLFKLALPGPPRDLTPADLVARWGVIGAWEVEEHVAAGPVRTTRAAVHRLGFVIRRPELDRDAFAAHWTGIHAPLVMASDPLFDHYVLHTMRGDGGPWDGIVDQRFRDVATWAEHDRRIVEERPHVRADIGRFVLRIVQVAGRDGVQVRA
jgi:hypothetical protein